MDFTLNGGKNMGAQDNKGIASKLKGLIFTVKEYWHEPAKGNYIPYKANNKTCNTI